MKQEFDGCNSSSKYGALYFIKHKDDMHAPAALQKLKLLYVGL